MGLKTMQAKLLCMRSQNPTVGFDLGGQLGSVNPYTCYAATQKARLEGVDAPYATCRTRPPLI